MNLLPQFGFFELLVVGAVILIVVGPRELPKLMRTLGRFAAQARRMASEFAAAFEQMARESEMEEMRREIEALKKNNVFSQARREVDEALQPAQDAFRAESGEIEKAAGAVSDSPERSS